LVRVVPPRLSPEVHLSVSASLLGIIVRPVFTLEALVAGPRLEERPVYAEVLIRSQTPLPSLGHDLLQEAPRNVAVQQSISVLAEDGGIPHLAVHAQAHKPTKQKVVVQLLHQQSFTADSVEVLEEERPQKMLRRDGRTPQLRIETLELSRQGSQSLVRHPSNRPQRMVVRHSLCRSSVAEHRFRLVRVSSHPSLRSYFTESNVMTCQTRSFSAAC
jgi:hypothetical protein